MNLNGKKLRHFVSKKAEADDCRGADNLRSKQTTRIVFVQSSIVDATMHSGAGHSGDIITAGTPVPRASLSHAHVDPGMQAF